MDPLQRPRRVWVALITLTMLLAMLGSGIPTPIPIAASPLMAACDPATVGLKGYLATPGGTAFGLAVAGTTAYVADWKNSAGVGVLNVLDVSDPCAPRSLSSTAMPANEIGDLQTHGGKVYVANDAHGLAVYDVTNPAQPARIAERLDGRYAQSIAYDGSRYAYVGQIYSAGKELAIYDMTNFPGAAPSFYAPSFTRHRDIYTVQLAGSLAYVLAGDGEVNNRLQVLDISTPQAPQLLGELALPAGTYGGVGDLRVRAGYAYLATSDHPYHDGGLIVVSVADPAQMAVVGSLFLADAGAVPWRGGALEVVGQRAFVVGRSAFYSVDIANPTNPTMVSEHVFPASVGQAVGGRVRMVGDMAYVSIYRDEQVAGSTGGLAIYKMDAGAAAVCEASSLGLKGYLATPGGTAFGLAVAGTTAYVADWKNNAGVGVLNVLDVGDPCAPRSLSSTAMPANEIGDLQAHDGKVYLANDANGLALYDLSNPAQPTRLAERLDGRNTHAVAYDGSRYAYVGQIYSAGKELAIYDMTNFPGAAPTFYAPGFAGHRDIYTVQLAAGRAYVLAGDGEGANRLQVLDVSNPQAPQLLGELVLPAATYGGVGDLRVRGDYAYLATSKHPAHAGGLVVIRVADPTQMTVVGSLFLADAGAVPWRGAALDVAGQRAFLVGRNALYSVDITNPTNPSLVSEAAFPASVAQAVGGRVRVVGDMAYVSIYRDEQAANSTGGLAIYKVDTGVAVTCDLVTIGLKGYLATPGRTAYGLAVVGPKAYVADWSGASGDGIGILNVLDVSNPCVPQRISSTVMPSNEIGDLQAHGDKVYLANDANGLVLYDVSVPEHPLRLGARRDGTYAQSVAYDGNRYAYVGQIYSAGKELAIYDMSNFPASAPTFYVPSFTRHRDIYTVQLAGGRAYVLAGDGEVTKWLQVLDISTPQAPQLLGELALPTGTYGGVGDLRVRDGYAYLATSAHPAHAGGLIVVSVADPAQMAVVGSLFIQDMGVVPWRGGSLDLAGQRAFLVGRSALYSLDITNPANPTLVGEDALPTSVGRAVGGRVQVVGDLAYVSIYRDDQVANSTGGLAIYKVNNGVPSLSLAPASGPAGSTVQLELSGFAPGNMQGTLTWDDQPLTSVAIPAGGMGQIEVTLPANANVGLHTLKLCAGPTCLATLSAEATFTVERALNELPAGILRRAAEHLADLRGSSMAPGWDFARLSGGARPLYRPDLEAPAYYEFAVVVPANPDADAGDVLLNPSPAGYIILAAGEHDFPVAHWSSRGLPPTAMLDLLAAEFGAVATKYYKLDALTYTAEDAQGEFVASLGPLPMPGGAASAASLTDALPAAWDSWEALKEGYATSYGADLARLTQEASEQWEVLENVRQFGASLIRGEVYDLALLADQGALVGQDAAPTVSLEGEGAALVSGALIATAGRPYTYRITVNDSIEHQVVPFNVKITYADGRSETASFAVLASLMSHTYLPIVSTSGASLAINSDPDAPVLITPARRYYGNWTNWSYRWIDLPDSLPVYQQIPAGVSPNSTQCQSGSGPTAWAILFGYADRMAALGYPSWVNYSGIYRQGGGRGADAVAPQMMDEGVRAMTWEIHQLTGTTCNVDTPITRREDMGAASAYLAGRTSVRLYNSYVRYSSMSLRIPSEHLPVVVGVGLDRYAIATGVMTRSRTYRNCWICITRRTQTEEQIYVNQLWGGVGDGWIANRTWFNGWIGR